jgi:hypothetical protein
MQLLNRLKKTATTALLAGALLFPVLVPTAAVHADVDKSKQYACQGIGLATGSNGCGNGEETRVTDLMATVVNVLSVVVGIAAIIMIVIAGFKYITSGGDSNKVASAKTTLIYAIVGLIVVALAQFLVHFVLKSV